MAKESFFVGITSRGFRKLAYLYVRLKKPKVIAVAGSVGKTSTKLMLAHILKQEKKVACMDDSYNNGLGLYLSVFNQKVPTKKYGWPLIIARALATFVATRPDILILEYGIDHPGDMDELVGFLVPDVSILTAVTPEHMEYLKTIDTVGKEEAKILAATKEFGIVNEFDVDKKYRKNISTKLLGYGLPSSDASFRITTWTREGAVVNFNINTLQFTDITVNFISEPLIRQLTGVALLAEQIGISREGIQKGLLSAQPAASRMKLLRGKNETLVIDDTTNFSPAAGIEALKSLKRMPATRRIALLGNMHELGEYEEQGFSDVAQEFVGIDILIFVGDLAKRYFGKLAKQQNFILDKNLFFFEDSPSAGMFVAEVLQPEDVVLVKGPFGGFYLEEAVKKLLKNKDDYKYLTRQSDFWLRKKKRIFGDSI